MTAPRHGLGAHHGDLLFFGQLEEAVERLLKFLRLHVVGEPAEGRVAPTGVWRGPARMSQAAQPR